MSSVFTDTREPACLRMARELDPRIHRVWVPGEPRPFPKKQIGWRYKKGGGKEPFLMETDFRTRKNPITGKQEKWDQGYKRRWMSKVTKEVALYMARAGLKPFPANHPVALGCCFYLRKPDSNKLIYPSQYPDQDNLEYAIWNALKRTTGKGQKVGGLYPNGVSYCEDDQIIWRLQPDGKLWATDDNPPGVLISFCDAFLLRNELDKWQNPIEQRLEV